MQKLTLSLEIEKISPRGDAIGTVECSSLVTNGMVESAVAGLLSIVQADDPERFHVESHFGNIHQLPNKPAVVTGIWEAFRVYPETRECDKNSKTPAIGEESD